MLRTATAAAIGTIGLLSILSPTTAVAAEAGTTTTASSTTTTSARPTHRAATVPRARRTAASRNATVTISTDCASFCFAPANTTVIAGGTVTWDDTSGVRHNVSRCDPASCSGTSGGTGADPGFTTAHLAVPAGGTAHFTFTQPGTYVYYCAIHGYALMHGTITVVAAEVSTTAPPVAAPVTPAPVVAAPATTAGSRLATTGSGSGSALGAALFLVVIGFAATAFRRGRRFS